MAPDRQHHQGLHKDDMSGVDRAAASTFTAEAGMAAKHEETRHYALATALLFEGGCAALSDCGFTIERALPDEGRIEASAGVNWKSFGEDIELTVRDGAVHARSSCKVSTTVFDFGRNRQNVEAIFRALESSLARLPAGRPDTIVGVVPAAATGRAPVPGELTREVFVSYAWGGESEALVERLERAFAEHGITVVRDKQALGYKADIRAFMERLGGGRCVIAVIGDKYLRSPHCMFELMRVAAQGNFQDRVFPVLLDDAKIHRSVDRVRYVQHWEAEIRELDEALKTVSAADLKGFREDIDRYAEIRRTIAELTSILGNMNTLSPQMHSESDFAALVAAVSAKLGAQD